MHTRRILALVLLIASTSLAIAQTSTSPNPRIWTKHGPESSFRGRACAASTGPYPQFAFADDTNACWKCSGVGGNWLPCDAVQCSPDPPSGLSCTGTALCRSTSGGKLRFCSCVGGVYQCQTSVSGGDMVKADYDTNDNLKVDTAEALAANGSNCGLGQAATGVDATGAAEGCFSPGSGSGDMQRATYDTNADSTVDKATALAANGSNCPANQAAAGVDATGSAEGCFAPAGSGDMQRSVYDANSDSTVDKAAALAADGTNCAGGQASAGVDASGNAEGCFSPSGSGDMTRATYDTNADSTVDKAAALAADGTNCAANQASAGVDAAGNAQGCFAPAGSGDMQRATYDTNADSTVDIAAGVVPGAIVGASLATGSVDLSSTKVTNTLPIVRGGTGATAFGAKEIAVMNSGATALSGDPDYLYDSALNLLTIGLHVCAACNSGTRQLRTGYILKNNVDPMFWLDFDRDGTPGNGDLCLIGEQELDGHAGISGDCSGLTPSIIHFRTNTFGGRNIAELHHGVGNAGGAMNIGVGNTLNPNSSGAGALKFSVDGANGDFRVEPDLFDYAGWGGGVAADTPALGAIGNPFRMIYTGEVTLDGTNKDANQGRITTAALTADRVWSFADRDGTVIMNTDTGTVTGTMVLNDSIQLATDTQGNYVSNVQTTAPLTGGSAGTEAAALTLSVAQATTGATGVVQLAGDLAGTATSPQLATDSVGASEIAAGAVGASELGSNVVGTAALDETVTYTFTPQENFNDDVKVLGDLVGDGTKNTVDVDDDGTAEVTFQKPAVAGQGIVEAADGMTIDGDNDSNGTGFVSLDTGPTIYKFVTSTCATGNDLQVQGVSAGTVTLECGTDGSGGGGGSLITQEGDVTVDGTTTTLDFGAGFDLTSSPSGETNVNLDYSEKPVNMQTEVTGTLARVNGGTGTTSATEDSVLVGNAGTAWDVKTLPSCSNGTTSKLLYDTTTNAFSCGTDQSGGSAVAVDVEFDGTDGNPEISGSAALDDMYLDLDADGTKEHSVSYDSTAQTSIIDAFDFNQAGKIVHTIGLNANGSISDAFDYSFQVVTEITPGSGGTISPGATVGGGPAPSLGKTSARWDLRANLIDANGAVTFSGAVSGASSTSFVPQSGSAMPTTTAEGSLGWETDRDTLYGSTGETAAPAVMIGGRQWKRVQWSEDCIGNDDTSNTVGANLGGNNDWKSGNGFVSVTTSSTDLDAQTNASAFGVCDLDFSTATAGDDAAITLMTARSGRTTNTNFTPLKVREFVARVRPGTSNDKRIMVGSIKTGTNEDLDTKANGIFFWCAPSEDVDGNGTAASANDQTWWAATYKDATTTPNVDDISSNDGTGTTTAWNTTLSCNSGNFVVLRITYDGTTLKFWADDEADQDDGAWDFTQTTTTNLPTSNVAVWGAWIEGKGTTTPQLRVDGLWYEGRR